MIALRLIVLLAVTFMVGTAQAQESECDDERGCVLIGPDEPVTIGYMLVTSGAIAFLGEDSLGGIELALDARGNELLGREIELLGEDSLCTPEGGQTAAENLVADEQVLGVIGTSCSSAAVAALPIISRAGYVMISPSNTTPGLTEEKRDIGGVWQPGYFRTSQNDLLLGEVTAQFAIEELGARTLATIHDGSVYAENLQRVMAERFVEGGGELLYAGSINVGDTDMTAILTDIAAEPPDILYFPIFEPEGSFIAAQIRSIAGLEETQLMSAGGLMVASFPFNSGEGALGMLLSGPAVAGDDYRAFLADWVEKYGSSPPGSYHAHAFDATNILLDAIEAIAVENSNGDVLIGRGRLLDAITATSGFDGITGSLQCSPTGDCATGEAIGVFEIGENEVNEGHWPPGLIWTPATGALVEDM
ncbi:MAG: branched-chain amino acid ABC transporter substrate-binding protein [Anaerolineaceae bacterium]|nr:branched-chain amino acid ABC transporter substrate-binding protein [Anaerolineaceae bacterium]